MPIPRTAAPLWLTFLLAQGMSLPARPTVAAAAGPASPEESLGSAEADGLVLDGSGSPLADVKVSLKTGPTTLETHTAPSGRFRFPALPKGNYRVRLEKEGYVPRTLSLSVELASGTAPAKFFLHPIASATVEVTCGVKTQVEPQIKEDIIPTETISPLDIRKVNAVSLTEAVDFKPGISVQTECSICNVRNVVLNNLPGRFTTIMLDGVPIFSSVSGAYGLDMIGVNGVESIEVSRGAGVSLIAPEALAGAVNLVSKHPTQEERILEVQGGDDGYRQANAFWAHPFDGGAITVTFLGNDHRSVDGNGNGVSEYTGYKRYLGGIGFFLDHLAGFSLRGRLDLVDEHRNGGALGYDYDAIEKDLTGNPFDWSRGVGGSPDSRGWIRPDGNFNQALADGQNPILLPDGKVLIPYDKGQAGFSEVIGTRRQQGLLVAERDLENNLKLKLAFGGAFHRQDSFYEDDVYDARQRQFYGEASLQWFLTDTLVTGGLNLRYEDLRSHGRLPDGTLVEGVDNYTYQTPAAFIQVYHGFFGGLLELNGSLRYDHNNVFGPITTPRLNLLWHHTPNLSSRFAIGRGFRCPTSFFEQDHGVLQTTRIDRVIDRPEYSDNVSYTFAAAGEKWALAASASYNRIQNFALLNPHAADPVTGAPITLFTQSPNPVTVKGLDGTLTRKLLAHLSGTLGAEHYCYAFVPGTLAFARPKDRLYLRSDYDSEGLSLMARATWTGPMDLHRFYDYQDVQRYNLDGTPKLNTSPAFWTVDLGLTWKLSGTASLLVNVKNAFDYQQSRKEDFLWVDARGRQDVTQLWGPGLGRSIQAGFRFSF